MQEHDTPIANTTLFITLCFFVVGCGQLYVVDGNWKLCYGHCMWKVPVTVLGFGEAKYPTSVCYRHTFCDQHCEMAVAAGYPLELLLFLKKCGVPDADKFPGTQCIVETLEPMSMLAISVNNL